MDLSKTINKLCTPAYLYFFISSIMYLLVLVQNVFNGNSNEYCAGSYTCNVSNVIIVFLLKALYITFWTFVLNAFCDYGFSKLSWFLVLFPYLLLAVIIGLLFLKEI